MASRRLLRSLKIAKGIALVTVGVLFRLPGDMAFGGEHWKVYVPLATCIVLSILQTLVMWLIQFFRRG